MAAHPLPVDWNAAKAALAMGARMEDVAKNLKVGYRTLQKRAQRGNWTIATKVMRAAKRAELSAGSQRTPTPTSQAPTSSPIIVSTSRSTGQNEAKTGVASAYKINQSEEIAGEMILQHLSRNDDTASVIASDIAVDALKRAQKSKTKVKLESIQDVDKALRITKTAAGKDREDQNVVVNLFQPAGVGTEAARGFRVRVLEAQDASLVAPRVETAE